MIAPLLIPGVAGDATPPAVLLDLERLLVSRLLVQANSGGGKSHAVRYLLEQTHGRVQQIVIDREGEFATLREKFPYLLVGPGGEVAADVRGAKLLARKLLELGLSAVIDLSELRLDQQRAYIAEFIEALNHAPRALWRDCLVVIDEAHLFAPEKGKGESQAREPIATLLSTGRKRGFCPVLVSTRLARLDKDASAECLNKLIGRTSSEDEKRAGEELGLSRAEARELRALEPGTFYAYGPAISAEPVLVRTGEIATRPPARGAARAPAPPTPAAIAAVAGELADLPAQAEEEEASTDALHRRIRQLEQEVEDQRRDVEQNRGAGLHPAAVEELVAAQRAEAEQMEWERHDRQRRVVYDALERCQTLFAEGMGVLGSALEQLNGEWIKAPREMAAARSVSGPMLSGPSPFETPAARRAVAQAMAGARRRSGPPRPGLPDPAPTARVPRTEPLERSDRVSINGSEQKLLDALALLQRLGIPSPDRGTLAFFSGYTRGGRFNNLVGSLRTAGLVQYPGDNLVQLTPAGASQASADAHPVRRLADLHAIWRGKLPPSEWKVLETLLDVYPDAIARPALAAHTGYTVGGRFNNIVGRLRSLGAVEYPSDGQVAASSLLFPRGLR